MGYVKTYRTSKNLFDKSNADIYEQTVIQSSQWQKYSGTGKTIRIAIDELTTYSISIDSDIDTSIFRILSINTDTIPISGTPVSGTTLISTSDDNTATFTTGENDKYIIVQFSASLFDSAIDSLMLVKGGVPYDYEAYNVTAWYDFCKKKTATGWADSTAQQAPF